MEKSYWFYVNTSLSKTQGQSWNLGGRKRGMTNVCSLTLTSMVRHPLLTLFTGFMILKLSDEIRRGREILPPVATVSSMFLLNYKIILCMPHFKSPRSLSLSLARSHFHLSLCFWGFFGDTYLGSGPLDTEPKTVILVQIILEGEPLKRPQRTRRSRLRQEKELSKNVISAKFHLSLIPWRLLEHALKHRGSRVLRQGSWDFTPLRLLVTGHGSLQIGGRYELQGTSGQEGPCQPRVVLQGTEQLWVASGQYPQQLEDWLHLLK